MISLDSESYGQLAYMRQQCPWSHAPPAAYVDMSSAARESRQVECAGLRSGALAGCGQVTCTLVASKVGCPESAPITVCTLYTGASACPYAAMRADGTATEVLALVLLPAVCADGTATALFTPVLLPAVRADATATHSLQSCFRLPYAHFVGSPRRFVCAGCSRPGSTLIVFCSAVLRNPRPACSSLRLSPTFGCATRPAAAVSASSSSTGVRSAMSQTQDRLALGRGRSRWLPSALFCFFLAVVFTVPWYTPGTQARCSERIGSLVHGIDIL